MIAPGFGGAKRELTVRLVRVLFPGAGLLVASAWCLGVLNSHGKFLLSYTAPVAWNAAMIATLVAFGPRHELNTLAIYLAWGSVAGSFLQFAVQAPMALSLSRGGGALSMTPPVRQTVRNFLPVLISRGAVQLTGYVDAMIASLLPTGAVTGLTNAQLLYTLPVSLFGVAISAAELPAMSGDASRDAGPEGRFVALERRINAGLARLAFFVVPSAVAFAALGDVLAGALLQRGRFRPEDSLYVWAILAGSSIGLLATTMARLVLGGPLRAGRHEASASLRHRSLDRSDDAWIFLRDRAAAAARDRTCLGCGRLDGISGRIGLDRIRAAPLEHQPPHRPDRSSRRPHGKTVDRRDCRGHSGRRREARCSRPRPNPTRHPRSRYVRYGLSRNGSPASATHPRVAPLIAPDTSELSPPVPYKRYENAPVSFVRIDSPDLMSSCSGGDYNLLVC